MMHHQRGADAKETDIPHRTKITDSVKERAKLVQKELIEHLKVSSLFAACQVMIVYACAIT